MKFLFPVILYQRNDSNLESSDDSRNTEQLLIPWWPFSLQSFSIELDKGTNLDLLKSHVD